ncbi:MAG TPA: hypothetical protein VKR83_15875 [Ktedonobacteraceae bacterium]|nr:hypothetical protein [Ktedonobacteraceae bacterium]
MVTTPAQKVFCPVCHQADQVKQVPAAYESGVTRLAPPTMPEAPVRMMNYIVVAFTLVTIGVFFILIWSGTGGYSGWPIVVQVIQVVLTILAIVAALVISFIAFQRVVSGDRKTEKYFPAYDAALENWRRLYYCKREDVVFDPQTNKTISDASLKTLLSVEATYEHLEQAHSQSAAVSH